MRRIRSKVLYECSVHVVQRVLRRHPDGHVIKLAHRLGRSIEPILKLELDDCIYLSRPPSWSPCRRAAARDDWHDPTMMKILGPQAINRLFELAKQPNPPAIVEQKKEIEVATVAAEDEYKRTGVINRDVVDAIVQMKMHLDYLYCLWAEDRL